MCKYLLYMYMYESTVPPSVPLSFHLSTPSPPASLPLLLSFQEYVTHTNQYKPKASTTGLYETLLYSLFISLCRFRTLSLISLASHAVTVWSHFGLSLGQLLLEKLSLKCISRYFLSFQFSFCTFDTKCTLSSCVLSTFLTYKNIYILLTFLILSSIANLCYSIIQ